ncbi:prolipoprotein diacylglyceryl transferase [Patescibacteria group bacterium]|nr:prolipoprotein diacylglyceryl transferase [Patescibacteria group bacterium]MBU1124038.1 prolipoprotein diacylglyceryl transferase [Patescibacteria group bacterium]MBU1911249.1 prolipoprotein diacylglyceryl transferase [Patescibacteria group bacterium]
MLNLFPSREIAIQILNLSIHWYGLMYLFGFLLAFFLLPRIQKYRNLYLTKDEWSSLLAWGVIGVILGGRLGFVLFYEPFYYLSAPLEIIKVWHGGMSSHGGFLGVITVLIIYTRRHNLDLLSLLDLLVIPAAIGLALGRLGNFINGELYGIETSVAWGMSFPGVDGLRHPTQIYAILKDLIIAGSMTMYMWSRPLMGRVFALAILLYGLLRFLVEYFRDQPYGFVDLGITTISRGQILTIPLIVIGLIVWWISNNTRRIIFKSEKRNSKSEGKYKS